MRLSRLLPCVVMGGMIGVAVFGQTQEEPEPYLATDVEVAEEEPAPSDRGAPSTAENVAREEQELRKQYLQLIEQKTNLMDRSKLREAISRTERDIDELKAAEKLLEARQLLLELVKTHPETNAARSARAMLQAKLDDNAPFYNAPRATPSTPIQQYQPAEPFEPPQAEFPYSFADDEPTMVPRPPLKPKDVFPPPRR